MLDTIVAAAVEEGLCNDPPAAPVAGSCFIVGAAPTGEWSGHGSALAAFSPAGWRFIRPTEGLQVWMKSTSTWTAYHSAAWELGAMRASQLMTAGNRSLGPGPEQSPTPPPGPTSMQKPEQPYRRSLQRCASTV